MTEGGEAEEASSPLRPENDEDEDVYHEQEQQPEGAYGTANTSTRPVTANEAEVHESEKETDVNLDYLDLNKLRPLSGSTIGSSSTLQTAIGSSAVPSKRQSTGKARDETASPANLQANPLFEPVKARRISNPSGDYNIITSNTTLANPSSENAPMQQMTTTLVDGQPAHRNPNFRHPILSATDGPAEENNDNDDVSLNIGALKRTISTLTFDDLTPETRTAFPASEATEVPPAYARPRSEVGLPPLLPGVTEDTDMEEEDEEDPTGMADSSREGFESRGRLRERPLSSQEYLSRARMDILGS